MEEKLEGPPGLDVMTSVQVSPDPTTDGQRRARVTVKFLPLINRQQSKGTVSLSIARQRQRLRPSSLQRHLRFVITFRPSDR
jgi:hypothetical protein